MKTRHWIAGIALAAAIAMPRTAGAAGYGIYEQGAAALGMAGAGTASVSDASALFFNPALLVRLDGKQRLDLGGSLLSPVTSFAGVAPYPGYGVTERMKGQVFPLPAFYYARHFGERWAGGLGFNAPFGLGVDWKNPSLFTGRYVVTKASLAAVNLEAATAYAIGSRVSLALGGDVIFSKVTLENHSLAVIPGGGGAQVDVASARLESKWEPGYGWNAGLSIAPSDRWRLGTSYRGKVIATPSGDADFTQIPTGNAAFDAGVAASLPPDQGVSTVLRFPAIWSAGAAWLSGRWKVEADAVFTEWSLFRDLPLSFDTTPAANRAIVEDYRDTWAYRIGAEHRLASLTYRFGYYFEQAAAPATSLTPLLPDAPRHGVTLGLGYAYGPDKRWTLDLYNLALFAEKRDTEGVNRDGFDGTYQAYVNSAGVNVGYRW